MHAMHEMYNMHDGTIIGYQKTLQQDGTPIPQNKIPVYCARCGIETTYSVYHKTASTDAPTYICMHHAGNCMNSCNTCNAPALPINTAMNNPSEMNLTTWGEACTRNHMAQSHYHTCSKMITRMADNLLVLPVCHSINYHMQCMHAMCPSRMVFVQNRPNMLTTLTACDWPSNPNEAMAAILHEMPSRIPQHTMPARTAATTTSSMPNYNNVTDSPGSVTRRRAVFSTNSLSRTPGTPGPVPMPATLMQAPMRGLPPSNLFSTPAGTAPSLQAQQQQQLYQKQQQTLLQQQTATMPNPFSSTSHQANAPNMQITHRPSMKDKCMLCEHSRNHATCVTNTAVAGDSVHYLNNLSQELYHRVVSEQDWVKIEKELHINNIAVREIFTTQHGKTHQNLKAITDRIEKMRKPATLNTSAEGIFNAHKHHDLWDEIKLIFDEAQVTHFLFSQMAGCSIYTLSSGSGMDADDFQNGILAIQAPGADMFKANASPFALAFEKWFSEHVENKQTVCWTELPIAMQVNEAITKQIKSWLTPEQLINFEAHFEHDKPTAAATVMYAHNVIVTSDSVARGRRMITELLQQKLPFKGAHMHIQTFRSKQNDLAKKYKRLAYDNDYHHGHRCMQIEHYMTLFENHPWYDTLWEDLYEEKVGKTTTLSIKTITIEDFFKHAISLQKVYMDESCTTYAKPIQKQIHASKDSNQYQDWTGAALDAWVNACDIYEYDDEQDQYEVLESINMVNMGKGKGGKGKGGKRKGKGKSVDRNAKYQRPTGYQYDRGYSQLATTSNASPYAQDTHVNRATRVNSNMVAAKHYENHWNNRNRAPLQQRGQLIPVVPTLDPRRSIPTMERSPNNCPYEWKPMYPREAYFEQGDWVCGECGGNPKTGEYGDRRGCKGLCQRCLTTCTHTATQCEQAGSLVTPFTWPCMKCNGVGDGSKEYKTPHPAMACPATIMVDVKRVLGEPYFVMHNARWNRPKHSNNQYTPYTFQKHITKGQGGVLTPNADQKIIGTPVDRWGTQSSQTENHAWQPKWVGPKTRKAVWGARATSHHVMHINEDERRALDEEEDDEHGELPGIYHVEEEETYHETEQVRNKNKHITNIALLSCAYKTLTENTQTVFMITTCIVLSITHGINVMHAILATVILRNITNRKTEWVFVGNIDIEDEDEEQYICGTEVVQKVTDSAVMADSGAAGGVDNNFHRFEQLKPSNARLITANGTELKHKGRGLRRLLVKTDKHKIKEIYDIAYYCPTAQKNIWSEGAHVKSGHTIVRNPQKATTITTWEGKVAQVSGDNTVAVFSDGDIVPMVKDGRGNIDYIEVVAATDYETATETLKRQKAAEQLKQQTTVNSITETKELTRKEWAEQLQNLHSMHEQLCLKQAMLYGASDEGSAALINSMLESSHELLDRINRNTTHEPSASRQTKYTYTSELYPIVCGNCEKTSAHSAKTCSDRCAECMQYDHSEDCSKNNTKSLYIHVLTKTDMTKAAYTQTQAYALPDTSEEDEPESQVDEKDIIEAYSILNQQLAEEKVNTLVQSGYTEHTSHKAIMLMEQEGTTFERAIKQAEGDTKARSDTSRKEKIREDIRKLKAKGYTLEQAAQMVVDSENKEYQRSTQETTTSKGKKRKAEPTIGEKSQTIINEGWKTVQANKEKYPTINGMEPAQWLTYLTDNEKLGLITTIVKLKHYEKKLEKTTPNKPEIVRKHNEATQCHQNTIKDIHYKIMQAQASIYDDMARSQE